MASASTILAARLKFHKSLFCSNGFINSSVNWEAPKYIKFHRMLLRGANRETVID
jgi:hypothetical protein